MNPNCHLAIPTVPMLARRDFLRSACLGGTTLALASSLRGEPVAQPPIPTNKTDNKRRAQGDAAAKLPGAQRLAADALQQWEAMNFGMFIHFGMSTFLVLCGQLGERTACVWRCALSARRRMPSDGRNPGANGMAEPGPSFVHSRTAPRRVAAFLAR